MKHNHHVNPYHIDTFGVILITGLVFMLFIYLYAAIFLNSPNKKWPVYRYFTWILGILCIAVSLVGPLAKFSHINFIAHMFSHLLLGMLAPLLITLSFPMTLLLRTLKVQHARLISRILKSDIVGFVSNPIIASLLNIGGLWILYTTNLFNVMHHHILIHIIVHLHIFLAGYLFTISMIYLDPTPHRYSFFYRATCTVVALAGHDILSKYIFIHPPTNVPIEQAQAGGKLMYYGGDLIDLLLIFMICLQWYKSTNQKILLLKSPQI